MSKTFSKKVSEPTIFFQQNCKRKLIFYDRTLYYKVENSVVTHLNLTTEQLKEALQQVSVIYSLAKFLVIAVAGSIIPCLYYVS